MDCALRILGCNIDIPLKVFKVQIRPESHLGASKNIHSTQHHLLVCGLLCAKKHLFWKDVLTLKSWITRLSDTLHLERIRYILNDRLEEFERIWRPISYLHYGRDGQLRCTAQAVMFITPRCHCSWMGRLGGWVYITADKLRDLCAPWCPINGCFFGLLCSFAIFIPLCCLSFVIKCMK